MVNFKGHGPASQPLVVPKSTLGVHKKGKQDSHLRWYQMIRVQLHCMGYLCVRGERACVRICMILSMSVHALVCVLTVDKQNASHRYVGLPSCGKGANGDSFLI